MAKPDFFLRSRVARRVAGLFLVGALIPTAVLAFLSYRQVAVTVGQQDRELLHREGKNISGRLVFQLGDLREKLIEISAEAPLDSARVARHRAVGLRWIAVARRDQEPTPVWGRPPEIMGRIPTDAWERPAGRRSWLLAPTAEQFDLLIGVGFPADPTAMVLAGFDPAVLWGMADHERIRPEGLDLCIAGAAGAVLHADPVGTCRAGSSDSSAVQATVFLGFEFGAPSWQVRLSRPEGDRRVSLDEFRATFVITIVLALAIVFMLANVQIRRQLTPLDALAAGTRRLANGELGHQVSVESDDEFRALARSFNGMSASLHRQFGLFQSLAELDRVALSTPKLGPVLEGAATALRGQLPGSTVAVGIAPADSAEPWTATVLRPTGRDTIMMRPRLADFGPMAAGVLHALPDAAATGRLLNDLSVGGQGRRWLVVFIRETKISAFLLVAADSVTDGVDQSEVLIPLVRQTTMAVTNVQLIDRLDEMSWGSLQALARTIDANSPWTAGHSDRVTHIAARLGRALGLADSALECLHRGGLLHDIGKIGVPSTILNKPDRLTVEERRIVVRHPLIGAEILAPLSVLQPIIPLVRWHHELLNGLGYPDHLAGDQIPLEVRILTVADVFDALMSARPYRPAWLLGDAMAHLRNQVGRHFDPRVVQALEASVAAEPGSADSIRLPATGPIARLEGPIGEGSTLNCDR